MTFPNTKQMRTKVSVNLIFRFASFDENRSRQLTEHLDNSLSVCFSVVRLLTLLGM
jgi:hypothetical protein